MPTLATIAGTGPMGHHSGTSLLIRVTAVFGASASLAGVFAIAGYLYWLHVIAPAPVAVRTERYVAHENRGFATQPA